MNLALRMVVAGLAGVSGFLAVGGLCNGGDYVASDENGRSTDIYADLRRVMVEKQIRTRGVTDRLVLDAMRTVPRHRFVSKDSRGDAYGDYPLPIGFDQTISQPYIVALMTELLNLKGGEKVLEIGTGSGYQAAVLGEIAADVYTIEIVPDLCERADSTLESLGCDNIHVRCGDGYGGWPEQAPFDAIMVTAAPDHIPPRLVEQLVEGGILVLPVGDFYQELKTVTKSPEGLITKDVIPVRFVPMTGEAEEK